MRKLLVKLSSILALGIIIFPLQASAADRIAATFPNGDIYLKEGGLSSDWHQLTSGVNVGNLSIAGDRVSVLDSGGFNKEVAIKEPSWNSAWNWTYWGSQPYAIYQSVSQLSNGQPRLVVQISDGSFMVKDGPWNTGWWSGTLDLPAGGVSNFVIGGDRIGIITSAKDFYIKQLTPGQFSHPNNTQWQLVANNVLAAVMNNNLIAYQDNSSGNVYAKEGAVNAPWTGNHAVIYDNLLHSGDLRVGGDRLCVVKVSHMIECKQGGMATMSIPTWDGGASVDVSSTRVAVRSIDLVNSWVLEGSLHGPNSGWQKISSDGVFQIDLNNK